MDLTLHGKNVEDIIKTPLDNFSLEKYIPNIRIMKYKDFKNFNKIEDIFNDGEDAIIILTEYQPEIGHWTAILNYDIDGENIIECFDSLFCQPEKVLNENTRQTNLQLGQHKGLLKKLLKNSNCKVIYNKTKYQKDKSSNCGGHCAFRILNLHKNNQDLDTYDDYIKSKAKYENKDFDEIVSYYIDKIQ